MLKSLIGTAILLISIPTIGRFAAGAVCFLMGIANSPGYSLWRSGISRDSKAARTFGMLLGLLGQCAVSLAFCVAAILLGRFFFSQFEFYFLFRWLFWAALLVLCVAPAYRTLKITETSDLADHEKAFYSRTLNLTCLITFVGFISLFYVIDRATKP
jgi:hypothetical protein